MGLLIVFLGLIFGSLGSVILTRFADGVTRKKLRGFFFGYSQCPHCHHRLTAKNLVPVVSYLVQGGKCAYCKKKISRIYPVLELVCAGIFVVTYLLLQNFGIETLVFGLLMNRLLVLLLIYDLRKYELHMVVRILLTALAVVANINISGGSDGNFLMSMIIFGITFLLIYLFAKRYVKIRFKKNEEGFGQGDVFLAVSTGILFPIIFSFHHLTFSLMLLAKTLILFTLMSSIVGLIRAGLQYLFTILFGTRDKVQGTREEKYFHLVPSPSSLSLIPFFPAMIVAFWILAWKAPYFITLLFG